MAKVTASDRDKYSATGDGRFPIKNKAQAESAIKLRGHGTTAAERTKILNKAAKFAPEAAKAARAADKAKK